MTRPLQVYLDEEDLAALERWSRARGWNKSQAIRAAVRALARSEATDPLLASSGTIDGLPPDLSARLDHYLQESFVAKAAAPRRPPRRSRSPSRLRR